MTEGRWTPGKWRVGGKFGYALCIGTDDEPNICATHRGYLSEGHANAHLICAAPDLYDAACQAMRKMVKLGASKAPEFRALEAATLRAVGCDCREVGAIATTPERGGEG